MPDRATESVDDSSVCDCKVGRVLHRRDLTALGGEMAERWRDGEASLRTLEREFNVAVLRAAARDAGLSTLEGEADNLYRLLTDDEVTSGMRVQARRRLENDGIDVDELLSEFVSHQTIYNHLTGCLSVERETEDRDPIDAAEGRVRPLQTRLEAVATDAIEGLRSDGDVTLGDFDVYVDVSVACHDCGSRRELGDFLDDSGCDCERA